VLSIVVAALLPVDVDAAAASADATAHPHPHPHPPPTTPTCKSLGSGWYFPNSCVSDCTERFGESGTMDIERSRNVNGDYRCYCVGRELPLCRDDPTCRDLNIHPGTALAGCRAICSGDGDGDADGDPDADVRVVDEVEFAGQESAANKNQTHFRVGCSCGEERHQCGPDSILFSDLTYLPSCSGGIQIPAPPSKNKNHDNDKNHDHVVVVANADQCFDYCNSTNVFVGSIWTEEQKSCACTNDSSNSNGNNDANANGNNDDVYVTMACDDSRARANDGSGLGDPCYETVGVSAVDCSESASSSSSSSSTTATGGEQVAKQTMVSSAAIMGIWLLPW